MDENFLLDNEVAIELYHNHAKDMPIFDYHCHLSPADISDNKSYRNITELWLGGDHYKWRVMRANGIDEEYITGNASDYDKFKAWTRTVPKCIGNPLYQWSHLELKRFFGIDTIINESTADEIWEKTNLLLRDKEFFAKGLIKNSNVKALCTTDDAIDSLEYHRKINEDKEFGVKVIPTLRPDKGLNIQNDTFVPWVNRLSEVSEMEIVTYNDFIKALENRVEFFHEEGCRLSDHGIDKIFFEETSYDEVNQIFQKSLMGEKLNSIEIDKYRTSTMLSLAKMYNSRGWTMQLHLAALRNNNLRMFKILGPDTGYDSTGDGNIADSLSKLLNKLDSSDELPKTILYSINPGDNDVLSTMIGNFQGGGIPGKLQFGTAWWFNDQKDGMTKQMLTLANNGLLSKFVGMVTDSRSFISYTRHEYFRRVLCNIIGTWVVDGEIPYDIELLGNMTKDICFNNAKEYFGIEF